jgi:hypothetical protein
MNRLLSAKLALAVALSAGNAVAGAPVITKECLRIANRIVQTTGADFRSLIGGEEPGSGGIEFDDGLSILDKTSVICEPCPKCGQRNSHPRVSAKWVGEGFPPTSWFTFAAKVGMADTGDTFAAIDGAIRACIRDYPDGRVVGTPKSHIDCSVSKAVGTASTSTSITVWPTANDE